MSRTQGGLNHADCIFCGFDLLEYFRIISKHSDAAVFYWAGKYNRNKVGPRMDPWGTPEVIGKDWDIAPSTVTL